MSPKSVIRKLPPNPPQGPKNPPMAPNKPPSSHDSSPSEPQHSHLRNGLLTLTGIVTFTTLLKIASSRYIGRPVFQGPGLQILERSNGIRIVQTPGRQVFEYPDGRRFVQEGGSQWWEIPKGWRGH